MYGERGNLFKTSVTSDYITEQVLLQDQKLRLYSTHASGQWTLDTVELRIPNMWTLSLITRVVIVPDLEGLRGSGPTAGTVTPLTATMEITERNKPVWLITVAIRGPRQCRRESLSGTVRPQQPFVE